MTTPSQTNGKAVFQCLCTFEIDPDEAARLLADPWPNKAVRDWLCRQNPVPNPEYKSLYESLIITTGEVDRLHTALGAYLTARKVAECKQLTDIAV